MATDWPALRGGRDTPGHITVERGIHGKIPGDRNDLRWLAASEGLLQQAPDLDGQLTIGATPQGGHGLYWRALPRGHHAAMAVMPSGVYDVAERPAIIQRQVWLWTGSPGDASGPASVEVALASLCEMADLEENAVWDGRTASFWDDHRSIMTIEPQEMTLPGPSSPELRDQITDGLEALGRALDRDQLARIYQTLLHPRELPLLVPLQRPLPATALACLLLPLAPARADGVSLAGWLLSPRTTAENLVGQWDVAFRFGDRAANAARDLEVGPVARSMADAILQQDPGVIRVPENVGIPRAVDRDSSVATAPAKTIQEIRTWWAENWHKLKKADCPTSPEEMAPLALQKMRNASFIQNPDNLVYFRSMPGWKDALLKNLRFCLERHSGTALSFLEQAFVWREGRERSGENDESYRAWQGRAMDQILGDLDETRPTLDQVRLDPPLMDQLRRLDDKLWERCIRLVVGDWQDSDPDNRSWQLAAYVNHLPQLGPVLSFFSSDQEVLELADARVGDARGDAGAVHPMDPVPAADRETARVLLSACHEVVHKRDTEHARDKAASIRAMAYALMPDAQTVEAFPLQSGRIVPPIKFLPDVSGNSGERLDGLGSDFLAEALEMSKSMSESSEVPETIAQAIAQTVAQLRPWLARWKTNEQERLEKNPANDAPDVEASDQTAPGKAQKYHDIPPAAPVRVNVKMSYHGDDHPNAGVSTATDRTGVELLAVAIAEALHAAGPVELRVGEADLLQRISDEYRRLAGVNDADPKLAIHKLLAILEGISGGAPHGSTD